MVRCSLTACSRPAQIMDGRTEFININEMPESSSAFVRDSNGRVSALVSMVKYSPTQAYCTVAEVDHKLKGKYITVEESDNPRCLKLVKIKDAEEDMKPYPVYVQVHYNPNSRLPLEHLIDRLSISILGQLNLDLKKNMTVDLLEDENLDMWRDKAAFLVTDRLQLCELTVVVSDFCKRLRPVQGKKIMKYDESQMEKVLDYDHSISGLNRATFLEHLFKGSTVLLADSSDSTSIEGYLVAKGNRILALYADSDEIAHTLLEKFLRTCKLLKVTMCTRQACWQSERSSGDYCRRIHRRHTRAVPANIKWEHVYAVNVGRHLL